MHALLDALLQLAATGVLALGCYAITHLAGWLQLREDSEVRRYLNEALARAVDLAEGELRRMMSASGMIRGPHIKPTAEQINAAIDVAASYAEERVPDALGRFGVSSPGLHEMLLARLSARLASHHAAG